MKSIGSYILTFFLFCCATTGLWAQIVMPHIDLTLRFEPNANRYEVYAKADSSLQDFYIGGGSQISLVLPSTFANTTLNITSIVGGPWADNSQLYAPSAQPSSDFHSISTNGTMPAHTYPIDEEVLLFTFTTPNGMCEGGIRLFRNSIELGNPPDPSSAISGMKGGDFMHYIGEVNTGNNYYKSNYANNGISCGGNPPVISTFTSITNLPEDSMITVCTSFSDVDVSDTFTANLCSSPTNGTATVAIVGSTLCVTYTPSANFTGMDSVCISVCDQLGNCDNTTAVFNVLPINDAPIAQNETETTSEDISIAVSLTTSDMDGPTSIFNILNNPSNGIVSILQTGIATYTPTLNFVGLDTFSYVICDGGTPNLCDTAFVYITVLNQNDPPILTTIGTTYTHENTPVSTCTTFSDSDIDDTFTPALCSNPTNGLATVTILNNELCVTYTPNPGYSGTENLCVSVCDQVGNCDSTIFEILVSSDTVTITNACLMCPADITVSVGSNSCSASVTNFGQPSTTGNCAAASISNNAINGAIYPLGETSITWTLTAENGTTATCAQVILIIDDEAPAVVCPPNITVTATAGLCTATVPNLGTPTSSDNCGVVSTTNDHLSSTYSVGSTSVRWTVSDNEPNTATCIQTITVEDHQNPTVACPADLTIAADAGTCAATLSNIGRAVGTDNCSGTMVTNDHTGFVFDSGLSTVVWTVTDGANNTATCAQTITVTDTQLPTILCPTDIVVSAPTGACSATVANLGSPSATDNCTVVSVENNASSMQYAAGTSTVIWTALDAANNAAICAQQITVMDDTNPLISCPADILVDASLGACSASISSLGTPLASDNCGVGSITNDHPSVVFAAGATTILWTVQDNGGNLASCTQVITVVDHEAPNMTCPSHLAVNTDANACSATVLTLGAPIATDNCSAVVTSNNALNTGVYTVGVHEVVWTATDANGNTATCTQNITVFDNIAPSITCPTTNINVNTNPNACVATITNLGQPVTADNCGLGNLTNNQGANTTYPTGNTTVIWTIEDTNGNTASCTQMVTVSENEAPTIVCPIALEATTDFGGCNATVPDLGIPFTTDNCGVASVTNDAGGLSFPAGLSQVVWTVMDQAGNTAICTQNITVYEIEPPSLTCPPDFTVEADAGSCFATVNIQSAPAASDNCALNSVVNDQAGVIIYGLGANVLTWTATDVNGNSASCSYTLMVESLGFGLDCPAPITVDVAGNILSDDDDFLTKTLSLAGCSDVALFYEMPSATTQCGTINYTQTGLSSGSVFEIGSQSVTFTARDDFDNIAECSVEITIQDMPTISLTSSATIACAGTTVEISAPQIAHATYIWSGPGGNFPNASSISIPNFDTNNEGYYDLTVQSNGCEFMSTDLVNLILDAAPITQNDQLNLVASVPMDSFSVVANDKQLPVSYNLTVLEPLQGINYLGNGQFEFNGSLAPGSYVFDYAICSNNCPDLCDTALVRVQVEETVCASIPNTISPNNDGVNDEFLIPCLEFNEYPDNNLVIYNQWGDVVFKAAPYKYDPTSAFKGLFMGNDGAILPDGAYYYIFQPSKTDKAINGFIQIFR